MMTRSHTNKINEAPVLFLHGFPFNRSMWQEQIEFLSRRGYRCIAPDLRGLGENRFAGDVATMEGMARDVAALMDELNLESAVICGLSMGGYVALDFVKLFPERALALVLAGTRAPADTDREKAAREQQVQTILRAGMVPISIATVPKLLARRTLAEKPDVVKDVRNMIIKSDPRGAAAAQRGMAVRRDYVADLAEITVPTLIIVGREDTIRPPADAEFMHRRIAGSQLIVLDDAAHLTNIEQPERFNAVMSEFLARL